MKKQTAVEWLQEQLKKGVDFNPLDKNSYLNNVEKLFEQAKAMEREQIIEIVEKSKATGLTAEYLILTYKGGEQ